MWNPNIDGIKELTKLFKESRSIDNWKQQEIYNKINEYSKSPEFPNYLVYILNSEDQSIDNRQISGLTLKGMMERAFISLSEESIEFFKANILTCYTHTNAQIRHTISNLINTFIRHGGLEMWPEILEVLYLNMDTSIGGEMSVETLNIIIEDSGTILEEKYMTFLQKVSDKLLSTLDIMAEFKPGERNEEMIILFMTALYSLIENCPLISNEILDKITSILHKLQDCENTVIKFHLGKSWLTIVRMRKEILESEIEFLCNLFISNFNEDSYAQNFLSAEFFLYVIDEESGTQAQIIQSYLKSIINRLVPFLLHYMKLHSNDISGLENKFKVDLVKPGSNRFNSNQNDVDNDIDNDNDNDNDKNSLHKEQDTEGYNPNWTLRKSCSKILDLLSSKFPEEIFELIKPYLENDMQHQDWYIKERSILALGALGQGSYQYLRPHLNTLIPFLIRELQHPNKFVRAISCWTLSRFTKFILIDNLSQNAFELFKDYLCEILKKFLDVDVLVREAACTAFQSIIVTKKSKLEPFLYDVFTILSSVLEQYTETNLLTLYDIISLMTDNFEPQFKNQMLVDNLIKSLVKKWYDIFKIEDYKCVYPILDVIVAVIRVSGGFILPYCEYFLSGCMKIIESNLAEYTASSFDHRILDKEGTTKSLEIISALCQSFPEYIRDSPLKPSILELVFKLMETGEPYINHYAVALIGDMSRIDATTFKMKINKVLDVVIYNIEFPDANKAERVEMEQISVCNNSIWTLGLISLNYSQAVKKYIELIMKKLKKMLSLPRLNKSLAQNIAICIGRLAIANPESVSAYLDDFLKQFCLSLRHVNDSPEKREAFTGLCRCIPYNPNGVMNHFAFFCDAICQFESPPPELEMLFQNLIFSYKNTLKGKWNEYFKLFPEKLKTKMTKRFQLNY